MKAILSVMFGVVWLVVPAAAIEFTSAQAGKITQVVGTLLELKHYKQVPLDNRISEMFLKNYLDSLDVNHLIFVQTDVDEFEQRYGKSLDEATHGGDPLPAFDIFNRYLTRLEERNQFVQKVLKEEFDFTQDESFLASRNKAPWPKDETEAESLWRARIKFELLQDRLAHHKPKKTEKPAKVEGDGKAQEKKETTPNAESTPEAKPAEPSKYNPEETLKTISKRYNRLLKNMKEFDREEILQIYLTALAHAYDPHSDYMSPTEASNFDINSVKLSLSGIGALLRSEDGYAKIVNLVPGGPAELSKQLKPNDRIIAVAQGPGEPVDTIEMKLNKVVEMIRGKRGTEVRLTIIPATSADGSLKKEVHLVRDEIKLTEAYAKARVIDHPDENGKNMRLGVITLPQFYEHCAADVEKLIERLNKEKVNGLVLDLRRNGGGLLPEAIALTGLFVKKAPVVQVKGIQAKGIQKQTDVLRDEDPKIAYEGPLIVLVGHLSASASEIVAAAVQDYGRALIVGDQATHGKGTVQTLQSLNQFLRPGLVPDAGKLKFTISKFYRVAGGTTQKNGVTPDLTLPSLYDYLELGEAHLPNCLEADKTDPVDFVHWDKVQPYVADLKKKSAERLEHNTDFVYLKEDIEIMKKQRADKTISLNEAKRLQESKEQEVRAEARKTERAQRKPTNDKVFELTLETVDQNKPLVPFAKVKPKENEEVAAINTHDDEDALADETNEPALDPTLEETLNIMGDYLRLLAKGPAKPTSEKLVTTP